MSTKEKTLQAILKYDTKNTRQIKLKLNMNTDKDILEKLDQIDNKQGYIKELIRRDIEKEEESNER